MRNTFAISYSHSNIIFMVIEHRGLNKESDHTELSAAQSRDCYDAMFLAALPWVQFYRQWNATIRTQNLSNKTC